MGNFEKTFLKCEKNGFKKDLPLLPPHEFLAELIYTYEFFKKFSRVNSKLNSKPYDYLY